MRGNVFPSSSVSDCQWPHLKALSGKPAAWSAGQQAATQRLPNQLGALTFVLPQPPFFIPSTYMFVLYFPGHTLLCQATVLYSMYDVETLFCSSRARPAYTLAPALNGMRATCRPPRTWKLQVLHACVRAQRQPSAPYSQDRVSATLRLICAKPRYPGMPVSIVMHGSQPGSEHAALALLLCGVVSVT